MATVKRSNTKGGYDAAFFWTLLKWVVGLAVAVVFLPWLYKMYLKAVRLGGDAEYKEEVERRIRFRKDEQYLQNSISEMGIHPDMLLKAKQMAHHLGTDYTYNWHGGAFSVKSWTENDDDAWEICRWSYDQGDQLWGDWYTWPSIAWCYNELICPGRNLDADILDLLPTKYTKSFTPMNKNEYPTLNPQ